MADLSKITGKLNLQKIISDVKSMINAEPVPEANQDDPVGYYLSEMNKAIRELMEMQNQQTALLTRLTETLGNLHKNLRSGAKNSEKPTKEVEEVTHEKAVPTAEEEAEEEAK